MKWEWKDEMFLVKRKIEENVELKTAIGNILKAFTISEGIVKAVDLRLLSFYIFYHFNYVLCAYNQNSWFRGAENQRGEENSSILRVHNTITWSINHFE